MILRLDPSDDMTDIFGRDEFRRTPSWWDRLRSTLGDFFDHLSFSWLGPVGQFLLWLVLIVAVVALVAFLWRRLRGRTWRRTRKPKAADEIVPIEIDSITDPDRLREVRAAFEDDRDYKQAILFRYRELVVVLMRERLVDTHPGRTTGELRSDLLSAAPAAHPSFDAATSVFEVAWFSDHPSTPQEFEELDRYAAETMRLIGNAAVAGATS